MKTACGIVALALTTTGQARAFAFAGPRSCGLQSSGSGRTCTSMSIDNITERQGVTRRRALLSSAAAAAAGTAGVLLPAVAPAGAQTTTRQPPVTRLPDGDTQGDDYMKLGAKGSTSFAKPRIKYADFQKTGSGLQYKDAKVGQGEPAAMGDRIVLNWEGYTIGYNGLFIEKKGGDKGTAWEGEKDALRFVVGDGQVIPGLEEGVQGMKPGGLRQLVIPEELGYPADDPKHQRVGPVPSTFSGRRVLSFVLQNDGFIDKTLLLNVSLIRADKPGQRGFKGGKSRAR